MENAASVRRTRGKQYPRQPVDLKALLLAMRGRHSANPIDKVCAIAFPFQKRITQNNHIVTFPIYDPSTPVPVAWERLISSIASAKMEKGDLINSGLGFHRTTTIQLLCLFPHPSRHHWFPSWAQVQQYPDVSVRDNDPVPVTGEMDYSLRIMSGRIYHGCSLELKWPPTSKEKAAYHCSMGMGSKPVELVATMPGIELSIDPRSTYCLVDISPDYSLWPNGTPRCQHPAMQVGHVHSPIWRQSVLIVCEEVDTLAQPVQATTSSPAVLRYKYRLRRITTLEWSCRVFKPPFGGWLPFKPSLEHMGSVVCHAEGKLPCIRLSPYPPDVFCDPTAVTGLPIKNGKREWDKCPVYEVYLV